MMQLLLWRLPTPCHIYRILDPLGKLPVSLHLLESRKCLKLCSVTFRSTVHRAQRNSRYRSAPCRTAAEELARRRRPHRCPYTSAPSRRSLRPSTTIARRQIRCQSTDSESPRSRTRKRGYLSRHVSFSDFVPTQNIY